LTAAKSRTVIDEWQAIAAPPPPAIVPIKINPAKTALFLLDFLHDVCTTSFRPRAAAALPKLQALLNEARKHGMTVVHTTTSASTADPPGSELADAIRPIDGERIYKAPFNKFFNNDLDQYLRGRGIDTIIATGTSPNGCLLFTTAGAVLLGFNVFVPVDGIPAATLYQEQFVAWQLANAPGGFSRQVKLTSLDNIEFQK
jgi:nicotinamidase-related amidase